MKGAMTPTGNGRHGDRDRTGRGGSLWVPQIKYMVLILGSACTAKKGNRNNQDKGKWKGMVVKWAIWRYF